MASGFTRSGPRSLRALVPASLRRGLRAKLGLDEVREQLATLQRRVERLETMLHESREEGWERSRTRWRAARPDEQLTWGTEITGDAFIERARHHGLLGADRTVLEVGPGYGRLLASCREQGIEIGGWIGIDLSAENIAHLSERFGDGGARFLQADAETVELPEPVDAIVSSLTFKHLFPSFESALSNLAGQLRPGGLVAFDLIEGERRYFEDDGVTYIRWYTREEVDGLLAASGLERVAFDHVRHHPEMTRLLVVARKPSA